MIEFLIPLLLGLGAGFLIGHETTLRWVEEWLEDKIMRGEL